MPHWPCPTCEQGRLRLQDKIEVRPNAETQECSGTDWWDPHYAGYVFTGMLRCGTCHDHVVVSCQGAIEQHYTDDHRNKWEYVTVLTPRFFMPALRVISPRMNDEVPEQIPKLLAKANEICWADPDSALNRLRTIVEEILDFKSVPRTQGRKRHGLQTRIELLTEPGMELVQRALNALKFVGNEASHGFSSIKHRELLEVFSILKYCLENIFPVAVDDTVVLTVVERINTNKGLRPRSANSTDEPL